MLNKKIVTIFVFLLLLIPSSAFALEMPTTPNDLALMSGVSARSYIVTDAKTGNILIQKNSDQPWTPASLTKLLTALVVLDSKTKLTKTVTMTLDDQVAGGCSVGGACIKSKAGVKYTVDGLLHAALIPSANNAANALARSTGLSIGAFVDKMNAKAAALGAVNSHFYEPTGMDPKNVITAADYSKIIAAAFANSYLQKIASLNSYTLRSANNTKYSQVIKNTNKLLSDTDVKILGAKTGYLDESKYNFASLLKYHGGQELIVVVLGEDHLTTAFAETKILAGLADSAQVLGATTQVSLNY